MSGTGNGDAGQNADLLARMLRERKKELRLLYAINELMLDGASSMEDILQRIVGLIPAAWQYPESACARIRVDDTVFATDDFFETRWMQTAVIVIDGQPAGAVDVVYRDGRPDADEGPFMVDERELIESLARRVGLFVDHFRMRMALHRTNQQLEERNQQLWATEQHLRAANQQLDAANQQLRAGNQQLCAANQQLLASSLQLSESEAHFRAVFDHAATGRALTLPDGRLNRVNAALCAMLGYTLEELQEKTFAVITHPDDLAASVECVRSLVSGERNSHRLEKRYIHRDGHEVWTEVSTTLLRDAQNRPLHFITDILDVSARKEAERGLQVALHRLVRKTGEQDALLCASRAVLEEKDFEPMARRIFDSARQITGARSGYVALLSSSGEENEVIFLEAGGMPCAVNPALPMPVRGLRAKAYAQGRAVYDNDFMNSCWVEYMPEGHVPLRNVLFAAINLAGRTIGIMGLANKDGDFTEEDREIADALAGMVAVGLQRWRAETALRTSEELYRNLMDNMRDCVAVYRMVDGGADFTLVQVNQALEKTEQVSRNDIVGRRVTDVFPGVVAFGLLDVLRRVGETGVPEKFPIKVYEDNRIRGWRENYVYRLSTGEIVAVYEDATERKLAEIALQESETRYRALHEASHGGIAVHDRGHILECNQGLSEITGYAREELIGMDGLLLIAPSSRDVVRARIAEGYELSYDVDGQRKSGEVYPVRLTGRKIPYKGKMVRSVEFRDMTEQVRTNAMLQHAQKMESIGRLAGGVAHDFNNMLGVILGRVDMAIDQVDKDGSLHHHLQEIRSATVRSAELTGQLLAFARRQTASPLVLNLNEAVEKTLQLLRRLIGEDIELIWKPAADAGMIWMDPSQLDQILANLCVNARDAIGTTGRIIIESSSVDVDDEWCERNGEAIPGPYVLLSVGDTGCGIDRSIMPNLFEPFFTTKAQGKGTGLGLSTVWGIVRQNGGFINVYSEPGQGAVFRVYLPRRSESPSAPLLPASVERISRGHETILLVEDEPAILRMAEMMLARRGYRVLTASLPEEAIRLAREFQGDIHLLVTDVIMPGMNGRELARHLQTVYPSIRCLFMSGYTADVISHQGVLDEQVQFIQKPFSSRDLARKVREALEAP